MKGKITTGIWLIFFGLIVFLDNFNVIDFNFYAILKFWPILIVLLGINLLVKQKSYGAQVNIITSVIVCVVLGYVGFTSKDRFNILSNINFSNKDINSTNLIDSILILETKDSSAKKLEFNAGGATILVNASNDYLLQANSPDQKNSFILEQNEDEFEITSNIKSKNSKDNFINLGLSNKRIWDITFNIGASKFEGNLESLLLAKLEVNSGATDLSLKLPPPSQNNAKIEINTAASSCHFSLPQDAACAIELSTIMSSNQLEGFTKHDGVWKTENYDTASKKYTIELNGAANSLKITRY